MGSTTVTVSGPRTAPAVLFIHAIGLDRHAFDPLRRRLDDDWRVIGLDLPGHGGSPGEPTLAGCAARALAVLDGLEVSRCHVVGHSFGGAVAALTAAAAPGRFASLGLIATPPAGMPVFRERARAATGPLLDATTIDDTLARWFGPDLLESPAAGVRYARGRLEAFPGSAWRQAWLALAGFDGFGALGELAPVFGIVGSADRSTPPAAMQQIVDVRGALLDVIPGGSHMMILDRPLAVARRLRRRMADAQGAGAPVGRIAARR